MEEWVIDSSDGTVPILLLSRAVPRRVWSVLFFRRPLRVVLRGSWMPDDYIDRVGDWNEARKVAAKSAVHTTHRQTARRTRAYTGLKKKEKTKNLLLAAGSGLPRHHSPDLQQIIHATYTCVTVQVLNSTALWNLWRFREVIQLAALLVNAPFRNRLGTFSDKGTDPVRRF